jgi:Cytochrome C oxidase, cbb3-type, subunit III
MNGFVLAGVLVVLVALRWVKPGALGWLAAIWVGLFVCFRFGFTVPIPASVLKIYMGIASGALLIYAMADAERLESIRRPLVSFLTEKRYTVPLAAVVVAVPALVGLKIYLDMTAPATPPNFARTVHPANPQSIKVHDTEYDLNALDNPYRKLEKSDPEAFRQHVAHGREVYFRNCVFCHGDLLDGRGLFAHGLNPIPTNFRDPGTISQLQEAFLFWRISKGGPGLPTEGGPWATAMPAWEKFLSEDEMWDTILFLYDFTDWRPRARVEEAGK